MLRLTKVVLHHICQYEDVDIEIAGGLNAVTGRNAGGKTNLLRAIAYGLTGKVDGSWGTQQKLQKDGTFDAGFVEVYFTGHGTTYRVRRFSTAGVKFPDELYALEDGAFKSIAVKRGAVDAQMTALLGIPLELFFQIMWGRQGELDYLLTAPAAVVNSFLSTVFDTKGLERLRDALKNGIAEIAQLSPTCRIRAAEAAKALEELPDVDTLEKELRAAEALKNANLEALQSFRSTAAKGMPESEYQSQRDVCLGNIALCEQQLDELEAPEKAEHPSMSVSYLTSEANAIKASMDEMRAELEQLRGDMYARKSTVEQLEKKLQSLLETSTANKEALEKKDDCCSLCAGKIVDEEKYYRQRCRMITGYDSTEEYCAFVARSKESIEQAIADHRQILQSSTAKEAELESALAESEKNAEAARQLLNLHALADRYDAYETRLVTHKTRLAECKAKLAELDEVTRIDDATAEEEHKLEAAAKEASENFSRLEHTLMETKLNKKVLTETLQENDRQAEQLSVNLQAGNVLTELRDALSSKRAQLRYLRGKIDDLNASIAGYFEDAQMPFALFLDPETHLFMYKSAEGFIHPAAHLSGAQKSIASVILQMGILTTVNPNMNLFMTDEPSEALDVENKFIQAELFAKLSAIMPAIEGVMLIVTRDIQLIEACGNNIEIQGAQE